MAHDDTFESKVDDWVKALNCRIDSVEEDQREFDNLKNTIEHDYSKIKELEFKIENIERELKNLRITIALWVDVIRTQQKLNEMAIKPGVR